MQTSTGYIQRIKQLRADGYSYQKIADQTGVSIKTAHKWGKNVEVRGKVKVKVRGRGKVVKSPIRPSFTPSFTSGITPIKTDEKTQVKVRVKGKTLPVWGCVIILGFILFFSAVALWLYYSPEKVEEEDNPDSKIKKTYGLDGRSYEELTGEDFEPLPSEEF